MTDITETDETCSKPDGQHKDQVSSSSTEAGKSRDEEGRISYPGLTAPTFDKLPKEKHKEISIRGGKNFTPKRRDAMKLYHLKKYAKEGKLDSKNIDWLISRLENREVYAADIINYLDEIRTVCHPSQRIALANAMNTTARLVHGDKVKIEASHIHAHIALDETEKSALLGRLTHEPGS